MTDQSSRAIEELLQLMSCLRHPQYGCAWDQQQNFATIAPHTVEEVYEVVDAIERNDMAQLQEELGDLLFQIVFYAQLGQEAGLFDFGSIAEGITAKLVRRHPHVFPAGTLASFGHPTALNADAVAGNWESRKSEERRRKAVGTGSALDDVPLALPGLLRAAKLQKRAAMQRFDWPEVSGVLAKLEEEIKELKQAMKGEGAQAVEEEFGDVMFTLVNLGRHLKIDAEQNLRRANGKFERRFRALESLAAQKSQAVSDLTPEEAERLWSAVKDAEGP